MYLLRNKQAFFRIALLSITLLISCTHEPLIEETQYEDYPADVGKIILSGCATTGCHNERSKDAAAGLSLASVGSLFKGGRNNAAVIPFSPQKSLLFLFTNTFDELGPRVLPTMPYGSPPLTKNEVITIRNWISAGAPDKDGRIAFSDDPGRKKVYVLNSRCDEVTVFDRNSGLMIRYVDAGQSGNAGFPESIAVAPDSKHWYVLFGSGEFMQFRCQDDKRSGQLKLDKGIWRSFAISKDSKTAYLTDWSGNSELSGGKIAIVDLRAMDVKAYIESPSDSLYFPLGITISPDEKWAFASCYTGNFIYKIDLNKNKVIRKIILDDQEKVQFTNSSLRPRAIQFINDQYLVVCEKSNELRVMNLFTDQLIKTVPLGTFPQEIAISNELPFLFVSCTEDQEFPGQGKGSVVVIDSRTYTVVKKIYTGYQPKSLVIDEENAKVFVVNRNADPVGADAPHHYTDCEGNNGYVTIIDMQTLELKKDYKAEVSVDPFGAAIRN